MSYENAPATKMLATHCAVCARPLVDAVSVDLGIGPECRRKHGFNDAEVSEAARAEGNAIVHRIAALQHTIDLADLCQAVAQLRGLGFTKLAGVLCNRLATVVVTHEGGALVISAPYDADSTTGWRRVPGRRWDGERKVNTAPVSSRVQVWNVLRTYYAGRIVYCPDNGTMGVIPGALELLAAA